MAMKLKTRVLCLIVILALLISSVSFLASMSPAVAQDTETLQLAPLNPDFLDFLQQPSEPFYGYVPPTMDLSHLKEIPVQREKALQALPATFDWRTQGKVTPVKDQGTCGTCWLFGTLAPVESRVWIVDGVEYDFSEQNVASCIDPAWVYLIDNRCTGGGNSVRATDVLSKKGTGLESCAPYNTGTINTEACNDACTTIKRITGYRLVADSASQITEVKNAIYDYGPVSMAYCHDDSYLYGNVYYWPDCTEAANHEVCIVGWDNTIEWPGGTGNGAWIVKNSWGTGFGDAGYFYLCYGSGNMGGVASYRYEDYDANETVYYWDEAGLVISAGYADTSAWMASVFTSGQDGALTHVDFWTAGNNATYELYIYDGSFGSQLAHQTGSCAELGYYSIPLTTPVAMTNGQQFTVAVKMTTPGIGYPLSVEYEIPGYCEPPIQTGVCFVRHLDGGLWEDVAQYGWNVCLRAKITTPRTIVAARLQNTVTPDGAISGNEWDDAGQLSLSFVYAHDESSITYSGTIYLKHDEAYLWICILVGDDDENRYPEMYDYAAILFDANEDGEIGHQDDSAILHHGLGAFDLRPDEEEVWRFDTEFGGNNDVIGESAWSAGWYTYEMRKPLNSGDNNGYDIAISPGDTILSSSCFWDAGEAPSWSADAGSFYIELESFDPMNYDADGDGVISRPEAVDALWDYFNEVISKEQAIEVLWLYFG